MKGLIPELPWRHGDRTTLHKGTRQQYGWWPHEARSDETKRKRKATRKRVQSARRRNRK